MKVHPDFWRELNDIRGRVLINPNNKMGLRDLSNLQLTRRLLEAPSWQQVRQELIDQNKRANAQNPLTFNIGIRIKKDKRRIFDL